MLDPDDPIPGDAAQQVQLPEAAQAVMDVLEECHSDLAALRYRLKSNEMPDQLDVDEEDLPSPQNHARHVIARLEACAGSLRKALDSEEQ